MGFGAQIIKRRTAKTALFITVAVLVAARAVAECSPDSIALRGEWGQARFNVEVADDPQERAQGLMNREFLAGSSGMLFIYPGPQNVSFWMKNTLIPLDMVFVDETGIVRGVHENAIPLDLTPINGGTDIFGVLEINGGLAKALGISIGTIVQHPSFDQKTSVWACEG